MPASAFFALKGSSSKSAHNNITGGPGAATASFPVVQPPLNLCCVASRLASASALTFPPV